MWWRSGHLSRARSSCRRSPTLLCCFLRLRTSAVSSALCARTSSCDAPHASWHGLCQFVFHECIRGWCASQGVFCTVSAEGARLVCVTCVGVTEVCVCVCCACVCVRAGRMACVWRCVCHGRYCSAACQQHAWHAHHKFECVIQGELEDMCAQVSTHTHPHTHTHTHSAQEVINV